MRQPKIGDEAQFLKGLGKRLRQARKHKKLAIERAAEHVGKSHDSIENWEKGSVEASVYSIAKLSQLYGVSVGWLVGEQGLSPTDAELLESYANATGEAKRLFRVMLRESDEMKLGGQ